MVKYRTSEEEYREAVANSISLTGVCKYLGIIPAGGNFQTIKNNIAKYNLDTSHFLGQAHNLGKIFIETPVARSTIKKRLIKERGHQCEKCKNTTWFDIPITLEVEHIDGNSTNNDFKNLLLYCPNCHSQTPTWRRAKSSFIEDPLKICPGCQGKKRPSSQLCKYCNYKDRKNKTGPTASLETNKVKNCACGTVIAESSKQCIKCAHDKQKRIVWPDVNVIVAGVKETSYSAMSRKLGVSDNAIRKYLRSQGINPKTFEPMV